SRALATRESTPAALAEIVEVLEDQTAMTRVWISLGADDASERVAAGLPDDARPGGGSLQRVLRRMPGDVPAQWVRIHQPGVSQRPSTRPKGGPAVAPRTELLRIRIEASGTTLGSIWATREPELGEPDRTETRLLAAAADQVGQGLGHDRLVAERQAA